jgi:hypothetical protein
MNYKNEQKLNTAHKQYELDLWAESSPNIGLKISSSPLDYIEAFTYHSKEQLFLRAREDSSLNQVISTYSPVIQSAKEIQEANFTFQKFKYKELCDVGAYRIDGFNNEDVESLARKVINSDYMFVSSVFETLGFRIAGNKRHLLDHNELLEMHKCCNRLLQASSLLREYK